MNRIQKKCFIASTGLHLLLAIILLVGPAFLSSNNKADNRPLIDFVPLKTIEEALSGGGNPNARPPAPQAQLPPPVSQPQPPAQPRVQPPEPPKPDTRERDSFDDKPVKKLPNVSLKPVTRPTNKTTIKPSNTAESEADAKARADAAKRKLLASAARDISESTSGSTTIELRGPGGGGVSYANFLDAVKKIYSDAWLVPDSVTDDEATTTASVTIARDGTVVASRIIRPSGNALADASVEGALRRVPRAVPLPDGAKEDHRTVTIKFNVKAKRGLG
jgi:TonB family protein